MVTEKKASVPRYPILHTYSGIDKCLIKGTITSCLPKWTDKHLNFMLIQMKDGSDPLEWSDPQSEYRIGELAGYNKRSIPPCFSDPTKNISGSFLVTKEGVVHHRFGLRLEEQYDGYVFAYAPDYYYTTASLKTILEEFNAMKTPFFMTDDIVSVPAKGLYTPTKKAKKTTLHDIFARA